MKTRTAVLAATVLAAALAGPASAGGPPVPDEVKALYTFVGTWKVNATMTMGGESAKVKATWTCKKISAGWGLACKFLVADFPGLGSYEENDLFGWDAGTSTYHWYSVTNAGEVHDHAGQFDDQGNFTAEHDGTVDGKKFKETVAFTLSGKKALGFRAETFLDGQSQSVLAGTGKKK